MKWKLLATFGMLTLIHYHYTTGLPLLAAQTSPEDSDALRSARTLQRAFAAVAKKVQPAVVNIEVDKPLIVPNVREKREGDKETRETVRTRGLGSGFLVDKRGYVLTNYHVVLGARRIKVTLFDRREYRGRLVGVDQELDLAVVKIEMGSDAPVARFADSAQVEVGDWAIAIGNPFGMAHTVTVGVVSAKGRVLREHEAAVYDLLQTDAAVNPGNSGGPLVNIRGEVIGMTNAILSTSGGSEGIGFAIPSNEVTLALPQLIEKGKVSRAWLGVDLQELTDDLRESFGLAKGTAGMLVTSVSPQSPSDTAGVQVGDLLTTLNGLAVTERLQVRQKLMGVSPGDTVHLTLLREDKVIQLNVVTREAPSLVAMTPLSPPESKWVLHEWRGLTVVWVSKDAASFLSDVDGEGLYIWRIEPDSAGERAGLDAGDKILGVERDAIHSMSELQAALANTAKDKSVRLLIKRENHVMFVVVKPGVA